MKKQCFKCGRVLDIENFYKHPGMKDGHLGKCKECTKHDTITRSRLHPEKVRAYEKIRSKTEKRKASRRFYVKKYIFPSKKLTKYLTKYANRYTLIYIGKKALS